MRLRLASCTALALFLLSSIAWGAGDAQQAQTKTALAALETWLGPGPNRDQWSKYLELPALHGQIADFNQIKVLKKVLKRLDSGAEGLDLPQFVQLRDAVSGWIDAVIVPTPAEVLAAVKAAQATYQPPTADELAAARKRLDVDLAALEKYLTGLGKLGAGWRGYLGLDGLRKELAAGGTNTDALWKIHANFVANVPGLEMPQFLAAGNALENYIELAEVNAASAATAVESLPTEKAPTPTAPADAAPAEADAAAADAGADAAPADKAADAPAAKKALSLEQQRAAILADLEKALTEYQSKPSEELAANIDRGLGWLWQRHLDRDLVHQIRACYGRPNFYLAVQKSLISTGVDRPIEERDAPLNDNILGTSIRGRSTTVGQVKVELVPSASQAMFDALLNATVSTNTVGQNGPATIYAQGTTQIAGRKRVSVDALGIHTVPATAAAVTRTQINGVGMSGLGQGVAQQRVAEGKPAAEREGARHAEARLRSRMDKEFAANLTKANHNYAEKIRNPLLRTRKFPALLEPSTTADRVQVEVLEANPSQLAAGSEPPLFASWEKTHPLVVVVNQTAVNNGATDMLAGVTLKDDEVRQKIIDLNGGVVPEQMANDEDQEPWSIRFAKNRPISLDVGAGTFSVTVRGRAFTTGEEANKKPHGAMNITATYKIEPSDAGPQLVRQGDLEIVPPNFNPATSKLSVGQISERTVLQKKFAKIFPAQVKPQPIVLGGRWKEAGHLLIDQLQTEAGWISAAYRWVPKTAATKSVAQR